MDKVKISIIVPIYNVEKYIKRCMDSLLKQCFDNYEIIAVNDGTLDDSMEVVYELQRKYDNIVICERENGGLSAARNTGIRQAKGEYLLFCDSDDALEENCLALIYEEAKSKNLDMLLYGAKTIWEKETEKGINVYDRENITPKVLSGKELLEELVNKGKYRASACLYLISRKMLLENGLFFMENILHEDELFTPIALVRAQRVEFRNWLIYMRYVRAGSITTSDNVPQRLKSLAVVIKELIRFSNTDLKNTGHMEILRKLICDRIRLFLGQILYINKPDDELEVCRKEVIHLVRENKLKLGVKFKCYLVYLHLRKMVR